MKHGATKNGTSTFEYNSWRSCKQRCYNKNHHRYYSYGAKGITVCSRWLGKKGFINFLKDMGERPEPKLLYSLERVNPYGNYEPKNCVWSTSKTQNKNFRARLVKHECLTCKTNFAGMRHAKYCSTNCAHFFNRHKVSGVPRKMSHITKEKQCNQCGAYFLAKQIQIYCSRKCREENQLIKKRKKQKETQKISTKFTCVCCVCKKDFFGYRPKSKCCSVECLKKHRNKRQKEYRNRF